MMFPKAAFLSLLSASLILVNNVGAIDLDVSNEYSIKAAAQKLAAGIITTYNRNFSANAVGEFNSPYYWWEAATVWDGLVEYAYLTGDSQWNKVVGEALQAQVGPEDDYMPPNQTTTLGNSDQSTWALAALTAAELSFPAPATYSWVNLSSAVFDEQVARWDDKTCNGGLRWQLFSFNDGYNYKDSRTAGNFFLLAARLAMFTGNTTYSDWAEKQFSWMQQVGLISDEYRVYDGTDVTLNCSSTNNLQWTASLGTSLEGAAIMYNITDGSQTWKAHLDGLVNASSIFLAKNTKIVSEIACENTGKCGTDQRSYKGIHARSLGRSLVSAPYISSSILPVLQASAQGAAKGCEFDDNEANCYLNWNEQKGVQGGLGEAFGALSVMQALLWQMPGKELVSSNGTSTSPSASMSTSATAASGSAKPTSSTGAANHGKLGWSILAITGVAGLVMM